MAGFLNVLKPPGLTSQQVVGHIRRLTGERRVGHAGTLDPAAIGVLPIAIGPATRLASSPVWAMKLYWADVRFGFSTDTDDAEGAVVAEGNASALDLSAVEHALQDFVGNVLQQPPAYSAVHVGGERAYVAARRGERPPLAPREVHIDVIRVCGWEPPVLSLRMQCQSGTYVRALARDLGQALGCPAHLASLVRLRVGPFTLGEALGPDELDAISASRGWNRVLYSEDIAASSWPALVLDHERARRFGSGQAWTDGSEPDQEFARAYNEAGAFLGIARGMGDRWQPSVVLPVEGPAT